MGGTSDGSQVSCPHCHKMLSSRSLSRHIDNVHMKSKPYLCKKCMQRFAMKHHLQNHVMKSEKNGFCASIRPRCNTVFMEKDYKG